MLAFDQKAKDSRDSVGCANGGPQPKELPRQRKRKERTDRTMRDSMESNQGGKTGVKDKQDNDNHKHERQTHWGVPDSGNLP